SSTIHANVDANTGNFSVNISADSEGNFTIDANKIAPNGINFKESIVLTVNAPQQQTGGFVGGGGGGTPRRTCSRLGGYVCSENEICNGELLDAVDVEICCSVACVPKTTAEQETTPQKKEEKTNLCENINCNDNNPCTGDRCVEGVCRHVPIDNIKCTLNGKPGICKEGRCIAVTSAKETTTAPTGLFAAANTGLVAGVGIVVAIVIGAVAYFIYFRRR
ncbi:MAG: hypothetical protein J7L14_02860, partial [Candidatus Diapherotrites archaeon]|nr:hypothetical protein [Candidatus Diapherotrites archaeon]